jgi:hypothetical protein
MVQPSKLDRDVSLKGDVEGCWTRITFLEGNMAQLFVLDGRMSSWSAPEQVQERCSKEIIVLAEVKHGGLTIRERVASSTNANHHVKVNLLLPVQGPGGTKMFRLSSEQGDYVLSMLVKASYD